MTNPMSENMLPLRLRTLITWTDFLQSYGSKRRGSRNPLTKQYCQKSLHAYAVGRLKALNFANGGGRIDDEEGPGGWDGAEAHKNENRQQPMLWIPNHAVIFNSTDSLATYGRKQWPSTQGIGTFSIRNEKTPSNTLSLLRPHMNT